MEALFMWIIWLEVAIFGMAALYLAWAVVCLLLFPITAAIDAFRQGYRESLLRQQGG